MLVFSYIARLLLAGVFLISGTSKLISGFSNSRKTLADFGIPKLFLVPFGFLLPVVELVTGCLLLPGTSAWFGAIAAAALLLVFNAAIAANLALGKHPQCNCFGQLHSEPIGWRTFARNIVMAGLACLLVWEGRVQPGLNSLRSYQRFAYQEAGLVAIAIAVCAGFALGGFLVLHLFRQNGRLLLRIESLEARSFNNNQPAAIRPAPFVGLPIGSRAVQFDLPNVRGSRTTLDELLRRGKPVLLISTDPNCGPCNDLMPDVVTWQKTLSAELTAVLLSHGRHRDNRAKATEHGLENVLIEKNLEIAMKYQAVGTPTGVLIRSDGTIGSPALGGADVIRQFVVNKAWTEAGVAAFMTARSLPPQPAPPKPTLPVGSTLPEFKLPDLDGSMVESAKFNGNGTVLLFWNPGCGFCQKMVPQLKDWERDRSSTRPRLVLVSGGSREANRAMGLESTVLLDDEFAVGQSCGANGTPSGVRIDAEGKIASALVVGAPGVMALLAGEKTVGTAAQVESARARSSH